MGTITPWSRLAFTSDKYLDTADDSVLSMYFKNDRSNMSSPMQVSLQISLATGVFEKNKWKLPVGYTRV